MYLGIDVGGTKVLSVVVARGGEVLGRGKKRIKDRSPRGVLERAQRTNELALEDAGVRRRDVKRVGMAVPSAVRGGVALLAPQLGWRNVHAARQASKLFKRETFVGNDVNMGVAAEYRALSNGERLSMVGFFLGSGLGGAVIQRGRMVHGADGMAGELGHTIVEANGRRCGCGNRGCLEAYASKAAFVAQIKEALFERGRDSALRGIVDRDTTMLRSSQLKKAYDDGDDVTREVIDAGTRYFGQAVASIMNALDPQIVVLGGGVIESFGEPMVEQVREAATQYLFNGEGRAERIVASELGDDAVPAGAALLAKARGELL